MTERSKLKQKLVINARNLLEHIEADHSQAIKHIEMAMLNFASLELDKNQFLQMIRDIANGKEDPNSCISQEEIRGVVL